MSRTMIREEFIRVSRLYDEGRAIKLVHDIESLIELYSRLIVN